MIEAELPDGTVLEFPEGTSPSVVQAAVKSRLGVSTPTPTPKKDQGFSVGQQLKNIAGGAIRGAGSIGATILSPIDAAARAAGIQNEWIGRTDRREMLDAGMRELLGADPESLAYQAGKIGTEVAGTAGVGGTFAKAAQATGAPQVLVNALRTAGMSSGRASGVPATVAQRGVDYGTRLGAGALTGAASAGLVNPEDAGTGAMIGGALPLAMSVARAGASGGRRILGTMTGAGDEPLRVAYESGKQGGQRADSFRQNMRGQADMTQVLDDARANLDVMKQNRAADYRQNMASVTNDKTVLDMTPIESSLQNSINKFTFKGQARNPQVLNALQDIGQQIQAWKQLDPAQFHTPEGLDALKQQIGSVLESVPYEKASVRQAVGEVYNSVKQQIEKQAPSYAKAMKDYTEASELISEINRTLSLNPKASVDTAMRKLQSIMRNNVNTNYGTRMSLAQQLEQQGGTEIIPALAGQALNNWLPRGIQGATSPLASMGAAGVAGLPAAAVTAAASSPRLMGEAAYYAGRADPIIEALRRGLYLTAPVAGAQ